MQAIKDFIKTLRHLPPAPDIVPELMRLLNQPDLDSSKIIDLISYDPCLTATVLRISNSAYFAAAQPTVDLQEAVTRLGLQQVYQLVAASTGTRLLNSAQAAYGLGYGDLWKHSVAAAVAGKFVARKIGDNENIVFTTALLHDIGKTILSQSLNGDYGKLIKETEVNGNSLLEAETKMIGANHAEVGAQLLHQWKFSPNIVSAVWFHHTPKGAAAHQRLASCVYMGNLIATFMGHVYGHSPFAVRGRCEVLTTLQLAPQSIPQLMMETFEEMRLIEALVTLHG